MEFSLSANKKRAFFDEILQSPWKTIIFTSTNWAAQFRGVSGRGEAKLLLRAASGGCRQVAEALAPQNGRRKSLPG